MIVFAACIALAGCQTTSQKIQAAAQQQGQSVAYLTLPDLPEACTIKMDRVVPKANEKWTYVHLRWQIVADNRDRQAAACAAWWAKYRATVNP
ncbi:hypothetical protein B7W85_12870 [Allorhizobium ampelinum]|nr:hypothetical protein B7W85_12870 [Allorhizobium ampelinum]